MFNDVLGQERVKRHFVAALRAWSQDCGGLHHAYVFTGGEGLGKRAFAEELGALIVAGGKQDDAYERARRGAHPDLAIIEREGELIRLEQVEPLVAELSRKPFLSSSRVWILLEAEKLGLEAANKLLKSLEEPPGHVFFLLVSDARTRLLPTILSRCEEVPFASVPWPQLIGLAEANGLSGAQAEAVVRLSRGSPAQVVALATDAAGPGRRGALIDRTLAAARGEHGAADAALELVRGRQVEVSADVQERAEAEAARMEASLPDDRDREWQVRRIRARERRDTARLHRRVLLDAVDTVVSVLRDVRVAQGAADAVLLNSDRAADLHAAAALHTPQAVAAALQGACRTRKDLATNVDGELALLALFCRIEEVLAS